MSNVQAQNAVFEAARQKGIKNPSLIGKPGSGAISQAEYDRAMAVQNQNYAIQEGYRIQAMPSTNEEAIAQGKNEYLPQAEKQQYYDSVKTYVTQSREQQKAQEAYEGSIASTMPSDPSSTVVRQTGDSVWVNKGSTAEPIKDASGQVTGYNITTPIPQKKGPQSIGEQIANFNPAQIGADIGESIFGKVDPQKKQQLVQSITTTMGSGIPGVKGTPTQFLGGLVASVETPAYAVGTLLGVKNLPQPPTTIGALLTSGWESATTGKLTKSQEYQALEEKGPAYAAGSIGGDILLAYGYGKGIGFATQIFAKSNVKFLSRATQIMGGVNKLGVTQYSFKAVSGRVITNVGIQTGVGYAFGGKEGAVQGAIFGVASSAVLEFGGRIRSPSMNQVVYNTRNLKNRFLNRFFPDWHEPFKINSEPPSPKQGRTYNAYKSSTGKWQGDWIPEESYPYVPSELNAPIKNRAITTEKYPALTNRFVPEETQFINEPSIIQPQSYSRNTAKFNSNSWGFEKPNYNPRKEQFIPREADPLLQTERQTVTAKTKAKPFMDPNRFADAEKLFKNSFQPKGNSELAIVTPKAKAKSIEDTWKNGVNAWGFKRTPSTKFSIATQTMEETDPFLQGKNSWGFQKRTRTNPTTSLASLTETETKTNFKTSAITVPKITGFTSPKITPKDYVQPIHFPNPKTSPSPFTNPFPTPNPHPTPSPFPQPNPFPNTTKTKTPFPFLGLGGGFDSLGRKGSRSGQWYQKKHKVKTAAQMLQTFGVTKIGKSLHTIDKTATKLTKQSGGKQFTAFRATKGKSGISEFKTVGKAMHFYPSKKRRTKK